MRLQDSLLVTCHTRQLVGRVDAVGRSAQVMHDHRVRIVKDSETAGSEAKAQIHILVIGWSEALVETTNLEEEVLPEHQAHAGAVVDLTRVVVSGSGGVIAETNEPRGAVEID